MLLFQVPSSAGQTLPWDTRSSWYSSLAPAARGLLLALPTIACIVITVFFLVLASGLWFLLYFLEGEPITWECQGRIAVWFVAYLQGAVFGSFYLPQIFQRFRIPVGWKYL